MKIIPTLSATRISRIAVAALAALMLLPQTVPAGADDAALTIGTIPIDPTAEVYYAQAMGFFKKAGLNVTITPFTSGGAIASAVAGGAVDIGLADSVSMASAHAHGLPLTYLAPAGVFKKGAETYQIAVPAASPIKTAKDFDGKTIAVNGLKNITEIPTDAWIDNNGGDAKSVKFIEMPYPAMLAALDAKSVDGVALVEPFVTFALAKGIYRLIPLTEKGLAPQFAVAGWSTTTGWARKHPDLAKKFIAVMAETAEWANANHAQSARILASVSKMPAEVAGKMGRTFYGERLEPALLQPVIDATAKYGVIAKSFPAAEIIDPSAKH
jgi:NitT/TauT family transport system substrate-binding protein